MSETVPKDRTWKSRACPGFGTIFTSFSLRFSNGRILIRRLSMWTVLLSRIIISIGIITNKFLGGRIISVVLGVVFAILNFFFITWCLSLMERAEGYRHFCCLRIGRNHLDIILGFAAIVHTFLLVAVFTFMSSSWIVVNVLWFGLWALIGTYGYICTKLPESAA